jgi:hypothetical protein
MSIGWRTLSYGGRAEALLKKYLKNSITNIKKVIVYFMEYQDGTFPVYFPSCILTPGFIGISYYNGKK